MAHRLRVSAAIKLDRFGNRPPIVAAFPEGVTDSAGLAALVEGAAADAGISFARFMQTIQAEAPAEIPRGGRVPLAPHRPARDWKTTDGASLTELRAMTDRYREGKQAMTMVDASGAALQEARKAAKMPRLSLDSLKVETAALKQAFRQLPPREGMRGKPCPLK